MEDVSHREIYDRLVAVETKVDKIGEDTRDVVTAFNSAKGAFLVLDWIGKLAKPILWLIGFGTVIVAAFEQLRKP
jgi:hypothetical protein